MTNKLKPHDIPVTGKITHKVKLPDNTWVGYSMVGYQKWAVTSVDGIRWYYAHPVRN